MLNWVPYLYLGMENAYKQHSIENEQNVLYDYKELLASSGIGKWLP